MDTHRSAFLPSLTMVAIIGCILFNQARPVEARALGPFVRDLLPLFSKFVVHASISGAPQSTQDVQKKAAPQDEIPLPEGKGRDITKSVCSTCHSTNMFARQRHTPEEWGSIVDNMASKGMKASDDELDEITDYLAVSFPRSAEKGRASTPAPTPHF